MAIAPAFSDYKLREQERRPYLIGAAIGALATITGRRRRWVVPSVSEHKNEHITPAVDEVDRMMRRLNDCLGSDPVIRRCLLDVRFAPKRAWLGDL
jgi:hypothetical protein